MVERALGRMSIAQGVLGGYGIVRRVEAIEMGVDGV